MDRMDMEKEWRPTMNGQINSQIVHAQMFVAFLQERTQKRMSKRLRKIEVVETLPQPDPIRVVVKQRQERLQSLGNTEALIEQARARVMHDAQSEFRLLMEQLNAPHLNNQDHQVEEDKGYFLQGDEADQPMVDFAHPEEAFPILELDEQSSQRVGER